MITLTAAAVRQIHASARAGGTGELALRVAAARAPDGSLQYGLGFDEAREGDLAIEQDGIELLIGRPSQGLLECTVIDFVEIETGEMRFIFVRADVPAPDGGLCGGGGCTACGGER
jgi:iron-sulfur cluster assembly protein